MPIYSSTGEVYEDEEKFLMNVTSPQDNKGLTQKEFNQRFHANERGRDGWYEMPGDVSGHYKNLDEDYASIPSAVYSRMDKFLKDNNYKINEEKWSEFIATQRRSENIEDARDPLEVEYDRMMREEPTQTYERKLEEIPLQSGAAPAPQNAPQIDSKPRTDDSSTAPVPQVGGDVDPNQIGQTETRSGAERYQLWPEKMVRDFATKLSNSKQFLDLYLEGKVAYDDPNLVNAVTTLASTVGNLGLATAPLRTGSVGTFGGTVGWSRTDPQIPELMKRLEKALPDEEITKLTGMWRGVDKKWRFEIPDKDAKLNEPVLKALIDDKPPEGMVSSQGLQYILKHDTLYKFYPELKDYRVEYVNKLPPSLEGAWAYFSKENKTIGITPEFVKLPKSDQTAVLLHEIQHGLQDIEGFAPGGNKTQSKYWRKARELEPWLDKAVKKFHEDRPDKSVPLTDKERAIIAEINEAGRKLQELDDKAFGEYWNLAGEKEARAVEDAYYKSIKILNPKERAKAAAEFQAYINSKKARDPNVPKGWDFT